MNKTEKQNEYLDACFAKAVILEQLIEYANDSVVSKTLIDKPSGTLTLFAFDAGQRLSEHSVPFDAVVQVINGQAIITIGGTEHAVDTGQVIIMPANVPHAVNARQKFKMLLTMIRSKAEHK